MKKTIVTLFALMLACSMMAQTQHRRYMKLEGQWMFDVDRTKNRAPGYVFKESVYLPGTTDTNQKGNPPARTDETTRLTRLHSFVGKALYKKKVMIPLSWKIHSDSDHRKTFRWSKQSAHEIRERQEQLMKIAES